MSANRNIRSSKTARDSKLKKSDKDGLKASKKASGSSSKIERSSAIEAKRSSSSSPRSSYLKKNIQTSDEVGVSFTISVPSQTVANLVKEQLQILKEKAGLILEISMSKTASKAPIKPVIAKSATAKSEVEDVSMRELMLHNRKKLMKRL